MWFEAEGQLLIKEIRERPERVESSIAEDDPEQIAQPEYRMLLAQCSILGVIAGIVGWLLAAYPY